MRKKSVFMFLLSLFTLVSGAFVSCSDDNEIGEQATKLEVTPSGEIRFEADGNENTTLSVKTDAAEWSFEKSEWVIASKEGNTLSVNAEANTSEAERTGYVTVKAGDATPVKIKVSQAGAVAGEITLSVTPSDAIAFEATGNKAVELTVKTNAKGWTYTYPDAWVTVSKEGDKLSVNAKDNTAAAREGEIVIKTSEGDKQVKIAVSQKGAAVSGDAVVGTLKVEGDAHIAFNHKSTEGVVRKFVLELDKATTNAVSVKLVFDAAYVNEYNFDNDVNYTALPESQVKMENGGVLTVPAGQTSATLAVTVSPDVAMEFITPYMVPMLAESQSQNLTMNAASKHANLFVTKNNEKTIRNICYFEVNDTNPLNAIEYMLEDGQPFFDAVVLFAGNIKWDVNDERVYMKANPNVQALLDESDVYLQPLRKKGIKVLMGILGDHDQAGIAGLSEFGCKEFAKELADVCYNYQLDGFSFDDEYSNYVDNPSNPWFTTPSKQAASRLLFETKMAMKKKCNWETMIHIYYLGRLHSDMPSVTVDGKTYLPGEFIDGVCSDYGFASSPVQGMGLSGCAGASIQLDRKIGSVTEANAKQLMDKGYGWIMWFAFEPSGSGSINSNLTRSLEMFQNMAKACYKQQIVAPKNVYNKLGEGSYDSTPHPIN